MRQLAAITRREAGGFFHGALAPVILVGFLVLTGLFFTLFTFSYSEQSLIQLTDPRGSTYLNLFEGIFQPLIADMTIFLLFLLPAVSMRMFSEEYRSGRYDLVMSYPVADHLWVLGKWLSVLVVATVLVVASGAYFGVVALLGPLELGAVFAGLCGLILMAGAVAAWGIFFSSLSRYQVLSYFLAFAFVLILYMIGSLEPFVPGGLGRVARELSLSGHILRFSRGVVDSRDVVYLLGVTVLGLQAATSALGGRRLKLGGRTLRWVPWGLLLAVVVVVYILALNNPLNFDLTGNQRYSLAPQTLQVLDSLGERVAGDEVGQQRDPVDVHVFAFFQRVDPARKRTEVLLNACRDRSPRFHFQMVDPEREPGLVEKYGVNMVRTVVVEVGDRYSLLLEPGESALINLVYRMVTGTRPVVYQIIGHGEHLLTSDERGGYAFYNYLLATQGYDVRALVLADDVHIPANGDIVVIAGPKVDYSLAELATLDDYIQGGGSLLVLVDKGTPTRLTEWIARHNVALGNDVIITARGEQRQFGVGPRALVVFDGYGPHPVTKGMAEAATLFPMTQSLAPVRRAPGEVAGDVILYSSRLTWSEQDPLTQVTGNATFSPAEDFAGPVPFGVALKVPRHGVPAGPTEIPDYLAAPEREIPDDPALRTLAAMQESFAPELAPSIFAEDQFSRLAVIGNSEFASNANLNLYGNRDLLLNIFGWLAQEDILIALRQHELLNQPVVLSETQKEIIGWGCVLGWPLLAGSLGLGVVLRQRHRR